MLRFALGLAVALWAGGVFANEQQAQYAPAPAWVKPMEIPRPAADSTTDFQVLLEDFQNNFGPDGDDFYEEVAQLIQTPQGLDRLGSIVLSWRPDVEALVIHKLHIIRDGQVIDVLANDQKFLVLRRENNLEMAMLDGALTAAIQPEGLQVGDILDLAFTLQERDPLFKGRSQLFMRNSGMMPIRHLSIREIWPRSKSLQWRQTEGLSPAKFTETPDGSELLIDMTDTHPLKAPLEAPGRFSNINRLEISEFPTWGDVSALMAPLFAKAEQLAPNSPIKAEVDKIAAASSDPKIRAAMALRVVQDKIRYLFLGMDRGGYIPADADRTWTRRFGDCKGKTVLLLAFLHALGIEAQPALVNSGDGDGLDMILPMAHAFDHVLVRARIGEKTYWLDGTRSGDRGIDDIAVPGFSWALPLQPAGATLEKLVVQPFVRPEAQISLRLDASKGLDVPAPAHAEQILRGDRAIGVKQALSGKSPADIESYLKKFWTDAYDTVDIAHVDYAFDEATGEAHLAMDGSAKMSWKIYRGDVGRQYEVEDSRLGWKADYHRDPGPHQDAPFKVRFPYYQEAIATILLPQGGNGFTIEGADVEKVIGGYAFKRTSKIAKGLFTMTASARSIAPEFPAADAPAAKKALQDLLDVAVYLHAPSAAGANATLSGPDSVSANPKAQKILAAAGQAFAEGDTERAIATLDEAVAADPTNADLLSTRAVVRIGTHDLAGAGVDIEKALKLSPYDKTVRAAEASLDLAKGQPDVALGILNDLNRANPADARILISRAHIYAIKHDREKASADFDAALRLLPNDPQVHLERAQYFLSINDMDRALADGDALVAAMPQSIYGHSIRAFALSTMRRRDEALREFDAAIAIKPTAELYFGRASLQGRSDLALADIDRALSLNPKIAGAYRLRGVTYFWAGGFQDAIKAFTDQAALQPDDFTIKLKWAAAYGGIGQYDAAIDQLDRLIVKQPNNVNGFMERCRYKALKHQKLDDALADCAQADKLDPDSDEVLETRAFAYRCYGKFDKAVADYGIVLARRPNSAIAHFGRAVAEQDMGSSTLAKADFVAARKSDAYIDQRVMSYMRAKAEYQASSPEMISLQAAAAGKETSDQDKPTQQEISRAAGHTNRRPLSIVKPYYPTIAEDDQIEGYVDFEFVVEPDGSVGEPKVTSEMPEAYGLADAAIKVFPQWKFTPEMASGAPVATRAFYRFSFKLH